ncbi:MAG TPA: acyltransferase, partial [Niastella sp.]|nr:acyltransferase [Niastella sp.]
MNKYPQLDLARSLAALFVFFNHLRYIIFLGFHEQEMGAGGKVFFFLTGFGHQSVIIFFVLSGFFISKSIVDSIERKDWSIKRYAIQRLTRLWVVLIPALGFTFLLDTMAWNYFNVNVSPGRSSFPDFLKNAFFLQNFAGPTFGSNLALWSLGNEFWYYVLLPFLLIPVYISTNRVLSISLAVVALAAGFWILGHLFTGTHGFFIFLMGTVVYLITREGGKKISRIYFYGSLVLFLAVLTFTRFIYSYPELADVLLGLAFALLAFTWLKTRNPLVGKYEKASHFLSSFSFTIYVTHVPLMLFFSAMFRLNAESLSANAVLWYCVLAVLILGICRLFYWLFERNTFLVRKYIEKR